jgi:hypothetical protein
MKLNRVGFLRGFVSFVVKTLLKQISLPEC